MYKLDSNKIDGVLKSLGNAGKNAVAALNAMTDSEFKGSALESDPLGNLGLIVRTLQEAKAKVDANARFEGKTAEEVSQMLEQERIDEQEVIKLKFNDMLAEHNQALEAPAEEAQPEGEPNGEGDPDPNA